MTIEKNSKPDGSQETNTWHVVQQTDGHCEIISQTEITQAVKTWGPFSTQSEAIAKRVGLIRAGKCLPQ